MTDWVKFEYSGSDFAVGTRVIASGFDREGRVVGWARSKDADDHWREQHGSVVTCPYGSECDARMDNEGPLVRYDDQAYVDASLDWFPGQSSVLLKEKK